MSEKKRIFYDFVFGGELNNNNIKDDDETPVEVINEKRREKISYFDDLFSTSVINDLMAKAETIFFSSSIQLSHYSHHLISLCVCLCIAHLARRVL